VRRLVVAVTGVAAVLLVGAGAAVATGVQQPGSTAHSSSATHHENAHDEGCGSDQDEDNDADDADEQGEDLSKESEHECGVNEKGRVNHSERSENHLEHHSDRHVEQQSEQHHP
jgi:hypothetical protein